MRATFASNRLLIPAALATAAAIAGCHSEPAVTAGGTMPAAAPVDPDVGAPRYAVCRGQGGDPRQLAPAFLDQMDTCAAPDITPSTRLAARGGDGKIEGTGDCQFDQGITCHFDSSAEFVTTDRGKGEAPSVGELQCSVPSANRNSPTVFGAHVRCKAGTTPASGSHACSHELLQLFEYGHCRDGWRCCDNGTLPRPAGKQVPAALALHPDFRICQDAAIEIDCGLLHDMQSR
jgi:hypothetical protein